MTSKFLREICAPEFERQAEAETAGAWRGAVRDRGKRWIAGRAYASPASALQACYRPVQQGSEIKITRKVNI